MLKFNFKPACDRHDFGYGNYKRLNLRKESHRKTIDQQFLKDLLGECSKYGIIKRTACRLAAAEYYKWVRGLGWIFNREANADEELDHVEREVVERRKAGVDNGLGGLLERDEADVKDDEEEGRDVSDEDLAVFMEEFGISFD